MRTLFTLDEESIYHKVNTSNFPIRTSVFYPSSSSLCNRGLFFYVFILLGQSKQLLPGDASPSSKTSALLAIRNQLSFLPIPPSVPKLCFGYVFCRGAPTGDEFFGFVVFFVICGPVFGERPPQFLVHRTGTVTFPLPSARLPCPNDQLTSDCPLSQQLPPDPCV
jgi:hypothetical protein